MVAVVATAEAWAPRMLSVMRIVTALVVLQHGTQKLFNFPPSANPRPYELMTLVPGLAGIIEFGAGVLLLIGLFSRSAAFLLSGLCAFAYWMAHAPRGPFPLLNGGDLAVTFCFTFLYLAFAGPGPWSVDALRRPRRSNALEDPVSARTDWAE